MKLAYADPPYPGQAYRYKDHPDYAGEVDHLELVTRLEADYPDGWALSTSARALRSVLLLCPEDVDVCVWNQTNSEPPGNRPGSRWWGWEPVIVRGGRPGPVRTLLSCGHMPKSFLGAKPPPFVRWMLGLLGAVPTDTIDDLFPGSGGVARAIESWRRAPVLFQYNMTPAQSWSHDNMIDRRRRIAKHHDPLWGVTEKF